MKERINKENLANEIAEKYDLTKTKSRQIVDYIFDRSTGVLVNKGEVSIYGFGKFGTKERKSRKGFNPNTKEKMTIEAATVPTFKPAKPLKDAVNKENES